jgi:hypothetical protein
MHIAMKRLPVWVFKWYKDSKILPGILVEYETMKSNTSRDHEQSETNSNEEPDQCRDKDLALLLLNFQESDASNNEKRKPPQTVKTCNKCLKTYNVNSAKQKCNTYNCNGLLVLRMKMEQQPKRKPPKCTKICDNCSKRFEFIPTALSKCKECGKKLSVVK